MATSREHDWTTGPAKLVAAIVLGGACISGLAWSVATRSPAPARAGVPLVAPPVHARAATQPTALPAITRLINVNTATAVELELLPGIGPALAQRIVADREARGRFRSINDLDRVSGIGPRTIERLRDKLTIE